jgi:hypothetical protein
VLVPWGGGHGSARGDHKSQGMGGGAVATCVRAAGVRRQRRWWVGAGRFRATRERAAHGNEVLGAKVGARLWYQWSRRGTGVRARSVGGAARRARRLAWARAGAVPISSGPVQT